MSERLAGLLVVALVVALVAAGPACRRAAPPAQPAGTKAQLAPNPFAHIDPGDYPAPTPVASVTRAQTIPRSVAQPVGEGASNKAVEIRVESYQTASTINGRPARPGRQFVVLETTWKNIIPLSLVEHKTPDRTQGAGSLGVGAAKSESGGASQPPTLESTPYLVPDVKRHLWLLSDGRFADPVDLEATSATPGHLSTPSFAIATLGQVLRGKVVFEAPAGALFQALQFLDTQYGHALISVKGVKSAPSPRPPIRAAKQNQVLELTVTEAAWSPTDRPAPPGLRYFTLGLRGISRSPTDIVELKLDEYAFLQTDQGCVAQPETDASWLARPFAKLAPFLPTSPDEGQLAFLVPSDTTRVKFLLRPKNGGPLDLAVDDDFAPSWPTPVRTIQDGSTLRVHVLPAPARPATLPPAPAGREQVLLDVVVENLKPAQGIEFNADQQLRLLDASGHIYQPDRLSGQLPCRLTGAGVIPAGGSRRFTLVYDMPVGQTLRLEYRGFERTETASLK